MSKRFTVETIFSGIDRVTAPVSRMQQRISRFTNAAHAQFTRLDRQVDKVAGSVKRTAQRAVVGATAVGMAVRNVTLAGADFGRAIGEAAAKFPEKIQRGTDAFDALGKAARRVGATTEYTATQAAQGLTFMARAGFSAEFSMRALGNVVDFATATSTDLAIAANIATDVLGSFGLKSKDAGTQLENLNRVMDVMSLAANSTNTTVEAMFEAIKDGAPISARAGASIETFAAAMGFLANAGIKGSKAGTAAKNMTLALAGVGNQADKIFRRLGIALSENGKLRDQLDVLDELRNKLKGVNQQANIKLLEGVFGKIPIAAATTIIGDVEGAIRELRKELEKAKGSSAATAAFIRNDVRGSIDMLVSAVDGIRLSIFSLNEGPLKGAIDGMTDWVRINQEAIASKLGGYLLTLINNFEDIVKWTGRIAAGLAVFIALKTLLSAITTVMALLAFPGVVIIAGVTGVVAALGYMVTHVDSLIALFDSLPLLIRLAFTPLRLFLEALKFIKERVDMIDFGELGDKFNKWFGPEIGRGVIGAQAALPPEPAGPPELVGPPEVPDTAKAQVVSPHARTAKQIEETRETSTSEVVITAGEGTTAEAVGGKLSPGVRVAQAGGFE